MTNSQEPADRVNVGLPDDTDELLKSLVRDTPWFRDELDAYRLAITVALAKGLLPKPGESETGFTTKFHVSGLDPDGKLALLIAAFAPQDSQMPYRLAQRLADRGVKYLHSALIEKGLPVAEVLGIASEPV